MLAGMTRRHRFSDGRNQKGEAKATAVRATKASARRGGMATSKLGSAAARIHDQTAATTTATICTNAKLENRRSPARRRANSCPSRAPAKLAIYEADMCCPRRRITSKSSCEKIPQTAAKVRNAPQK